MTSIKLIVTGASARAEVDGLLTSGMVGIPVTITYDSAWAGLTKALVCRGGSVIRTIVDVGDAATVPHECMIANTTLQIGVEGRNADGTLVIPTVWARCGLICSGANADADPSADPTLPVWAQIQSMIGNLDDLETEAKNNLVAAINEAMTKVGGTVDPEAVQKIVDAYLAENPPAPGADGKDGADGITPTIGDNGNWYLGDTDTGNPSRGDTGPKGEKGEKGDTGDTGPQGIQGPAGTQGPQGEAGAAGADGKDGADGKSAYQYAVEGGYTGTEAEFKSKMAAEYPKTLPNPNALTFTGAVEGSYDGSAPLSVKIPSGGESRTFANDLLSDGTIASGLDAWAGVDTGLTVGDLRKYKSFIILITGDIKDTIYYSLGTNIGMVHKAVRFEWEDDAKTILMCDGYSSYTELFSNNYKADIGFWGVNHPWVRFDFRKVVDSKSVSFSAFSGTSAEYAYKIVGWMK